MTAFNNVTVMAVMGAIGLKVALAKIETTFGTKMINLQRRKRAHRMRRLKNMYLHSTYTPHWSPTKPSFMTAYINVTAIAAMGAIGL